MVMPEAHLGTEGFVIVRLVEFRDPGGTIGLRLCKNTRPTAISEPSRGDPATQP